MTRSATIAALASALLGCSVSQDQEVAIGKANADQVEAQLPVVKDPYITAYINELGDTIAKHTSRADLDWHFYVVNSPQINAFALPGGYVYVNTGLIDASDRVDELAGVLGHEIGHVILRHSVKQMQNQQKVGAVATITCTLTNLCNSGLGQAAINIGGTALFARYSRKDELQADSEAVENVLRVNIDPEGIPSFFEVLLKQRQQNPSIVTGWFSDHPLEESRIRQADALIRAAGADQRAGLMQNVPSYAEFKRRVAALPQPASIPNPQQ